MTLPADEMRALALDAADPLGPMRDQFHIPTVAAIINAGGEAAVQPANALDPCVYLVGNSLGLQPTATLKAVSEDLYAWQRLGVEGHFHAKHPWFPAHEFVRDNLAAVVGALPSEVVAMNSLTTNLHLLCASFYRPTRQRHNIVIEDAAFPSDSYAMQSQLDFHADLIQRAAPAQGFDPRTGLIRLKPKPGTECLTTDDILAEIDRNKNSIALLMLSGVNYRTGQFFDMKTITAFAQARGITVGWDLAHAAGNIRLQLHDWSPDFAAWCSYKYLNSGPGAIAGAFVHERHHRKSQQELPRLAGWWGNDPKARFRMGPDFTPVLSADSWQLSNPPILALTPLRVSLELYQGVGMEALEAKSRLLTGYFESLFADANAAMKGRAKIEVLTPTKPSERGCQLSLRVFTTSGRSPREVHKELMNSGMVTDFREPDVIRAAPVPLYNSFHDVWRFVKSLQSVLAP
jgi:kynureninase